MLQFVWIVAFLVAFMAQAAPVKLRVNHISVGAEPWDPYDFPLWTISGGTSASFTQDGITFKLTVPSSELRGSRYKLISTRPQSFLGERVIGEGISTDGTAAVPITLTLTGLSAGTHSLLSFHNGWDSLANSANIKISVNGATVISSLAQTVRKDSIWDAASSYITFSVTSGQAVTIVYTPLATSGVTDLRAFINGWELDTSNIAGQVRYPIPGHGDEHYESGGAVKWQAPKSGAVSYDVYLSTNSATSFQKVSSAQTGTSYTFAGVITLTSRLSLADPYVTLAGQTAPGKGIALIGLPFGLSGARDAIVRHMARHMDTPLLLAGIFRAIT
ncbi:hypothetical protein ABW20_dc0110636 [Dactylellina cionopaga]|nr:hypothetical protein ABW20_dc0110636 [Dactylellina cionopaga]